MRKCYTCQEVYPLTAFYKGKYECKECDKVKRRKSRAKDPEKWRTYYKQKNEIQVRKNRQRTLDILKQSFCVDCGEKDPLVLEWDHISGTKVDGVMTMVGRCKSWKSIEKEIEKCEVRCVNCHRRITHKRANTWLYQQV